MKDPITWILGHAMLIWTLWVHLLLYLSSNSDTSTFPIAAVVTRTRVEAWARWPNRFEISEANILLALFQQCRSHCARSEKFTTCLISSYQFYLCFLDKGQGGPDWMHQRGAYFQPSKYGMPHMLTLGLHI